MDLRSAIRVHTVLIETAELTKKSGKLSEGRRWFAQKWIYDSDGNLVEEVVKGSHRLYRYDREGNRYEKRNSRLIMGGPPTAEDFHYEQAKAADCSSLYKWVSKYDAAGNRIEETIYSGVREVDRRLAYKYDANGLRAEVTICDAQGSTFQRFLYAYDATGRITEQLEFKKADTIAGKRYQDFEFDSAGNWIKRTTSRQVTKDGKSYFEPVEVTYRTIAYY